MVLCVFLPKQYFPFLFHFPNCISSNPSCKCLLPIPYTYIAPKACFVIKGGDSRGALGPLLIVLPVGTRE